MKTSIYVLILFCACVGNALQAADKTAVQLNVADGDIAEQVDLIMKEIEKTQYSELSKKNREVLIDNLAEIESGSLDDASIATAQAEVNKILTKAFSDSKLICTYYQVLGTRQRQKACMTVAEKKAAQNETQRDIKHNAIQSLNQSAPLKSE